ncbi:hypothetical protein PR048_016595 [Dryococelus australis]|uniref:Uncharacterized protein n=1 Tax=Dryococelus australis TaxID=614101 RepID=A0ABQ9H780_9NEOP|nr:hypothetical protein PR048_016595 [Dryococelus australis]
MEMYGVKYGVFIAEGDESVYAKIFKEDRMYKLSSEKLCDQAKRLGEKWETRKCKTMPDNWHEYSETWNGTAQNVQTTTKLIMLKEDIINSPSHKFGENLNCKLTTWLFLFRS